MRFHVVGLPHTQTDGTFTSCAYTEKVRKFANMMTDGGHHVVLYAGERNTARCAEHIALVSEAMRLSALELAEVAFYTSFPFDPENVMWVEFNTRAIEAIKARYQPGDILCFIGGAAQYPIMDAFPDALKSEFGIGYTGIAGACSRVYESYAWLHTIYGQQRWDTGSFFDAVIPNYFEAEQFPIGKGDGDYYLFMGRLIPRKGLHIAQQVCENIGARLIIAGSGSADGYGTFVGPVGAKERARLMGGAKAMFAPTLYIEPFGGVAIEANLCGTPVITTDFGAFTETVKNGVNGYRCRSFAEFVWAAHAAPKLDRVRVNASAQRYTLPNVRRDYERYFTQLATLEGKGFYAEPGRDTVVDAPR